MKKLLALLLTACMLLSMTACGKTDSNNNSQVDNSQDAGNQNVNQQNDAHDAILGDGLEKRIL